MNGIEIFGADFINSFKDVSFLTFIVATFQNTKGMLVLTGQY